MRIHHFATKVTDPERSLAVYVALLGLTERRRWLEEDGQVRSIWLDLEGGVFLALERARSEGARRDEQPGHHCLVLAIAPGERAGWRGRVESAGLAIERESPYTLYFRDPDGNLIGLSHYPEAAT